MLRNLASCLLLPTALLLTAPVVGHPPAFPAPEKVLATLERVADWQLRQDSRFRTDDWVNATFYVGLTSLAEISSGTRFDEALIRLAEANVWRLGPRTYFADDHCIGQTYASLFLRHRQPHMIAPMRATFDRILARPKNDDLRYPADPPNIPPNPDVRDKWSWCDALFMAPPAWVQLSVATGERAYLDFAVQKWWMTSDVLYDPAERLYFRDTRFLNRREKNGQKVFWSRGNGWVIAALARVLQFLPREHPSRARFEEQFRQMAERILGLQQSDGFWRAGLLDPDNYPAKESSGTAFFCYGLAWGVNHGLLDRPRYLPAILRAWRALEACAMPDGRFVHVQPIGSSPQQFPADSTAAYGTGGFLLAGSEVYQLAGGKPAPERPVTAQPIVGDRARWVAWAKQLAAPVLGALERRELKKIMPVEANDPAARRDFTHLEALGRLLAGLARWLELPDDGTPEAAERARLARLARAAIDAATDPASPDFMNFTQGRQPLVDAAFLAQAMLRAPTELWRKLDARVKGNVIAALKSTRTIEQPVRNNWVLFASTIEAMLQQAGEKRDERRLFIGLEKFKEWYVGDGVYGDGSEFHWDYYNAYVIHPMLVDVLAVVGEESDDLREFKAKVLRRAQRYAEIQEKLVAPDGSFPAVGRSLAYRAAAFQTLADMAWRRSLPESVPPAQARLVLTRVLQRTLEAPGTFDSSGWLKIGLAGRQPSVGEGYVSTGSLYLCAVALLPLGLPPTDEFWTGAAPHTTWEKAWGGIDLTTDHALREVEPAQHASQPKR